MRLAIGFNADVPVREIVGFGKDAENLGFESLWMHEHSFGRDAVSNIASVASSTSRMKLGLACLTPFTRHPAVLAMTLATLQESSAGRMRLGIGTGFPMRLDLLGVKHDKSIGALRDTIEICREIWSGSPVNYSGSVFSVKNVKSLLGKTAPPPIYIAGWKKMMLSLTGRRAEGYVAKGGESVQSMKQIVSDISRTANSSGRSIEDIDIAAYLLTLVGKTSEDALSSARADPFVAYMLSVQDDYLYEGTGIDPAKKKPIAENYFRGNIPEASKNITDEMLEAFTLVGTEDHVFSRVREYLSAGLNLPILQPISTKKDQVSEVLKAGSTLIGS